MSEPKLETLIFDEHRKCVEDIRATEDWELIGTHQNNSQLVRVRTFEDAILFIQNGGVIVGARKVSDE